ncbi:MAG: ParB/RepB/Spo0J family partition protein, partial [Phycisphaerae bacterium]
SWSREQDRTLEASAIDRAKAYRRYCTDFGLTAEDVAHRVGEDRTTVTNYIRLLDLPPAIRTLIAEGRLSMGHGRCLLGCPDPERQVQLAEDAVAGHLSVRTIEDLVRRHRHTADAAPDATGVAQDGRSAHIRDLERRFEDIVKTKVTIHEGRRRGTGRITIEYYSLDDFDRIASLIGIAPE